MTALALRVVSDDAAAGDHAELLRYRVLMESAKELRPSSLRHRHVWPGERA